MTFSGIRALESRGVWPPRFARGAFPMGFSEVGASHCQSLVHLGLKLSEACVGHLEFAARIIRALGGFP